MPAETTLADRRHIALHLAHRWFAFLEAPGGDLSAHLTMFHPEVRLSGHRGTHMFANDHRSLVAWFAAVPDTISSHHIVHSVYSDADNGQGVLRMVVAYQAPGDTEPHGSIISYETRIEFAANTPRFVALDKTPTLSNTRPTYETSWATNRVLSLVHAELGGITRSTGSLRAALGDDVRQVFAQVTAPEGSRSYEALITSIDGELLGSRAVRIDIQDDIRSPLPTAKHLEPIWHSVRD